MRPGQAAMRQHPLFTAKAMRAAMPCRTAKSTGAQAATFDPFLSLASASAGSCQPISGLKKRCVALQG